LEGYRITNPPHDCFPLPESYVSCNGIAVYDDVKPTKIGPYLGQLSKQHLAELRSIVAQSDNMAGDAIKLVCGAISLHLTMA
jgi:hypothetical protein